MSLFERYPERRRVHVTTKTDKTFDGILWRKTRGHLVLKDARLMGAQGEQTPMDGELVIDRANVDVIQVL